MGTKQKERKTKKPPKPASIYRKPIEEGAFRKKYLECLELEKDKVFLEASFDFVEGHYILKDTLDRPALVRLNALAKAIAGNRGFVKTGPVILGILLAFAGGLFVLFFMNPLLERALERSLESTFGARAEVDGFRLRPWNLRVSIASISMADRLSPMTNLFETGRIELRLSPAALLRGRVYIEEASAASLAAGTPRKTSGALPGESKAPAKEAGTSPLAAAAGLVDFENFDAAALLEREKDKLRTTAAYAEAAAAYEAASARWKDRVEQSRKAVDDLKAVSKSVLSIDPKTFRTLDEATAAISAAKSAADTAKATADDVKTVAAGVRADAEAASALAGAARAAVRQDLDYLKSFIDPKSGAARGALEPSIRQILDDKLERYIYYGSRALEAVKEIGATPAAKGEEKKLRETSNRGRDVVFPSAGQPRFRLGLLASSFSAGEGEWQVELRELSTEPDLVPFPTTLSVAMRRKTAQLTADATADLRSTATEAFSVDLAGTRLPVDLGDALSAAGLGGFTGRADAKLDLKGGADGGIIARAGIDVREAAATAPKGMVGRALAEAVASVEAVRLSVAYDRPRGADGDLTVGTNLDTLVSRAISAMAERYAKEAAAKLEAALRAYVGVRLEGTLVSAQQLDAVLAAARGDAAAAESLRKAVEDKRAELEGRAKAVADEARRKAEDAAKQVADKAAAEARKAAEDALKKADLPISVPKVSPPKIKF